MSLSITKRPVILYDSSCPKQSKFANDVNLKITDLREIEVNACPLSERLLVDILEKMRVKPSSVLINEKSPWYRCFSDDFYEMSDVVLIRTLVDFPSLLKTPIVILDEQVFVDPKEEYLPIEEFAY
ncbi:arsenate reductase family protein [Flammeovirga kamogawensis]|uniref:Arsenate reductase n=1 Tax=Flammeovirga kamogawensis TaxID=373891 RepID=A0ABX8GU76_9BACT|nr:ArsC/Spx/MgsR family protein [Flammeovirga kamogawensis]MBB6460004.1 arsenate reductase-like glutaredoxin family protein [Flammeovirga kamogawensis]QWG06948.1 hypothetical protein KM029_16805 [Flammeovirga kamogawensis]TRX68768.1 hypothetical protein EO216_11790 [Flammeovirga kamogawensis]